jgi:hypothetical protein
VPLGCSYLAEAGFAPTWPTDSTWARVGVRPLVRHEAPQRRRVNALGALAPVGPRPRFVRPPARRPADPAPPA